MIETKKEERMEIASLLLPLDDAERNCWTRNHHLSFADFLSECIRLRDNLNRMYINGSTCCWTRDQCPYSRVLTLPKTYVDIVHYVRKQY